MWTALSTTAVRHSARPTSSTKHPSRRGRLVQYLTIRRQTRADVHFTLQYQVELESEISVWDEGNICQIHSKFFTICVPLVRAKGIAAVHRIWLSACECVCVCVRVGAVETHRNVCNTKANADLHLCNKVLTNICHFVVISTKRT